MRKNDKFIVILGVVILVISSIGIYLWVPEKTGANAVEMEDILKISGVLSDVPDSVTVSDCNPFYALIATPIAVHYTTEGDQFVIPLYIENLTDPSDAVERLRYSQLVDYAANEYIVDGNDDPKNTSLQCAEQFWEIGRAHV